MNDTGALEKIFQEILRKGKDEEVDVSNWGSVRAKQYRGYYAFLVNGTGAIYDGSDVVLVNGEVIDPSMNMKILYDYPIERLMSTFKDVVGASRPEALRQKERRVNPWLAFGQLLLTFATIYYLLFDREVGVILGFVASATGLAMNVYYRRSISDIAFSVIALAVFGYYIVVMFLQ